MAVSSDFDTTVCAAAKPLAAPPASLLSRFRRITSGAEWIPEVDGLRFVAIASVVLFHLSAELSAKSGRVFTQHDWYRPLTTAIANGHIGVLLFFAISGFILGRPFARQHLLGRKPVSLRAYFLRRVTRLEPPYVLNLLLCAIAIALYEHRRAPDLLRHFAVSAVYLHNWIYGAAGALNPVAWTLEVEVQFYLVTPLLGLAFLIRRTALRRGLLLGLVLALPKAQEHWLWPHLAAASPIWGSLLFFLQYFLAGLLLADVYVLDMARWRPSRWWDAASAVCWWLLFVWTPQWLASFPAALILLAYLGAFRGVVFRRIFRTEWLATIGGMCYSIYLWHFFLIALLFKQSRRLSISQDFLANLLLQCAVMLPMILAGSAVYFLLVERPCMDPAWPQKLRTAVSLRLRRPWDSREREATAAEL